jgi:N-acetyl sugar amidotransferase
MITYCTKCVMPETKPDLGFDSEGVCNACKNYENRAEVDWEDRRHQLEELLTKYRVKDSSNYDCIVPVSGGKDSTYQVIKVLELGLNPLCVTATTDYLTELGRKNIENIKRLGVDYIEVSTNPVVRRKMNRLALEQVGDISWPEHVAIFTIPIRIAVQLGIKLIVWGENPQNEYGGPATSTQSKTLTRRWLEEFGGLLGLRVSDLIGQDGIRDKDLIQYTYPTDDELSSSGVTGIFLGYFLPWDGLQNALIAEANGFLTYGKTVEGSMVGYENLDNAQTGIHDYFKFLKYGFGRATDIACMHLRRGRLTRQDAISIVQRHDGVYPTSYLGVPLQEVLDSMNMTKSEFDEICDRFTNKRLFVKGSDGGLLRDNQGSLTKVNYDNLN